MLGYEVIGVAALTQQIKELLESRPELRFLRVRGEITNARTYASGHWYFNLREGEATLRCVLFRSTAQWLTYLPNDGDEVIATGTISVYERDGVYQLYVDLLEPLGDGALRQQLEQLMRKLEREGLFDPARKRALPLLPRCIAVVTSPHGAVWHDIQTVLRRRYPFAQLILAPARVQGDGAVESLVAALEAVQRDGRAEVVIIARGGGSLEDLWCFNDERLARAVFACHIPVVSAIGHQTDWTICDYVADHRAPTPSAAAELVTPYDRATLLDWVSSLQMRLDELVRQRVQRSREQLGFLEQRLARAAPRHRMDNLRQRLDHSAQRLDRALAQRLAIERQRVSALARELELLSPLAPLVRGYLLAEDATSGKLVRSIRELAPRQRLRLHFQDGRAEATIDAIHGQGTGGNSDG
ncbi:MAG: exodeoxyribonuclease VII large subunit [Thermomicrobium sp.]|nr:exodeoxyribonuclease VII large subunit [Thermomicrobium sp.]